MSQSPPSTIGKYQIIREIARSNDIVYEAYDPAMNRRLAVKELAMPSGATPQQREDRTQRFLREARAAGSLVHPNIVTVFEVGDDAGRRFIAMEFLDGHNLRNLLDTKGMFEPERAVEVTLKVLAGLHFAHSKGVIHRDVKPDNIQVLENGEVKLTDFGIARLTFEPNLTMDGQVFGTPSYMSPEQINGREIDARSDVFSVGVILYEMLAGRKPFTGDNVVAIAYSIMNHEPEQPPTCTPALWRVIKTAIEKSPQLRYSSAKAMAEALDEARQNFGQTVAPAPPVMAPPPQAVPYGQPYGQVPTSGPMGSSYVPAPPPPITGQPTYQPYYGQPYGQIYGQTGQQPQFGQIPVYYPPPPRRRTVSPAARQFLGRLFVSAGLIGALFFLVITSINALSQTPTDNLARPVWPALPVQPAQPGPTDLVADARNRAWRAIEAAAVERDPAIRASLWATSSQAWSEAVRLSDDPTAVKREAVSSYLTAARELNMIGNIDLAREAIYQAEGFAQNDYSLSESVERWKNYFQ